MTSAKKPAPPLLPDPATSPTRAAAMDLAPYGIRVDG